MKKRVVVIGGGASGMMAAIAAAEEGAQVTIFEHNDRVGKKILSTGNGRCNFTNTYQEPECYRSDNPDFAWKVISRFPMKKLVERFSMLGIYPKEKNGCLYPFSEQASAILDVLRMEVGRLDILIRIDEHVSKIEKKKREFQVYSAGKGKKEQIYSCDSVILATGSKASQISGSDGSGYQLAKTLGHRMIPVVPALVQLKCRENFYKSLSGVRVHGKVTIYISDKPIASDIGEIQLTAYGISGIPVFQVSRFAARGIYNKKAVKAVIDFMPDLTEHEFITFLEKRIQLHPEKEMEHFFTGLFNKKLALVFLKTAGIRVQENAGTLSDAKLRKLADTVKHFCTEIVETNSFEQAQVCAGGINVDDISPDNMESLLVKGLFFAGEILDVDGMCGGYNLQWAWSSGYLAGKGAASDKNQSIKA